MPRLDCRLKTVARQIRCRTHADIGSDHGHLLKALLAAGRIERGIAVENKRQPYENSRVTLAGWNADVRFGDGLQPLVAGEADCISICGMGGESIEVILDAFPDRLPPLLVLQPNKRPECVRRWGLRCGFHLVDEQVAVGHWPYQVLALKRADNQDDPAYEGVDREAALLFGPLMIKRRETEFIDRLREEQDYLRRFDRLIDESRLRLEAIERVLG